MPAPAISRGALRDTVAGRLRDRADHRRGSVRRPAGRRLLSPPSMPDLDLFDPWDLPVDQAVEIAQAMPSCGLRHQPADRATPTARRSVHHHGHFVLANSLGFRGGYPYSRHTIACSPIARAGREMQRDDWYSSSRSAEQLADPAAVGRYAAERALARLGARKICRTRKVPVLFEAPLACGLLGHLVQAVSGGALYRKASFLVDSLGQEVFAAAHRHRRGPDLRRRVGQLAVRQRGRAHRAAQGRRGRRAQGLLPVEPIRRANSACRRPAMPAAATT